MADLALLCREAAWARFCSLEDGPELGSALHSLTQADVEEVLKRIPASTQRGAEVAFAPTGWDDIGGLAEVKARIQRAVVWPLLHRHAFERFRISAPRGILLYGPPGCSKTKLVRAIATASNLSFLSIDGASIYSPFVGDAEKAGLWESYSCRILQLAHAFEPSARRICSCSRRRPFHGVL